MQKKILYLSLVALFTSINLPRANASGAIVWQCTSPDISSQYLPSSCSSTASGTPTTPTPAPTKAPTPPSGSPPPGFMCPPLCGGGGI